MSSYKQIALTYNQKFGMNVLPLRGKRPMLKWDIWQKEIQTEIDINNMEWTNSTGIGVVQGVNNFDLFDFDGVEDYEIIEMFLTDLGLPEKYCWVVQSGSGEGFHIHVKIKMDTEKNNKLIDKLGGPKAVYKFKLKKGGFCKHIELRVKDCQTALPPSMHESGGVYNFYFDDPNVEPTEIELERVIEVLEKYCITENEKSKVKSQNEKEEKKEQTEKIYYDKERLEAALEYLSKHLPDGSYEDWYRIGFALVPLGEVGEKMFVDFSLKNPNYKDSEISIKEKFKHLAVDYNGSVSFGSIYHIAELYGWKKPIIKFWYKEENGRLRISRTRFKKFLEGEGYCKYRLDNNFIFVRIENNIVEEIDGVHIKEYVMTYLNKTPIEEFGDVSRNDIIDSLIKSAAQLFTAQFFEFLITREIKFNKDTHDNAYLYFRNGFVEISKNEILKKDYQQLEKAIWKQQILDRNFEKSEQRTDFEDFLFNVCGKDLQRYEALKSSIGYLLHQFKNPTVAKSIVFIDEKLSEGAFGRSGKGVVIKAIGHLRNVVIEDGRNFNPSKNFAFQRVKVDTDILALEDIRENFPFERLFAIITDGIVIERKNKDEMFIPFSESPKLAISTNFSVKGVDDSTLDRQFIIEFSDYYNMKHRPIDDFGKLFFQPWNIEEWHSFDTYMMECLQFYLKRGLVEYEFVNIDAKKLIDETCPEFAEFSNDLTTNTNYDKKDLYKKFKEEFEDYDKLTQGRFTRWLKTWARINGYTVEEMKSGALRRISFKEKKK